MRHAVLLVSTVVLTLLATAADASPITFEAVLNGANDGNNSPGTGSATVVLDPIAQTLQLNVTFVGLTTPDVAAHIHCCQPPNNVGVATSVPAFPGFPLGVTAGTYNSPVFDLTQSLIYNPAFVTAQGGLPQAEAALIAGLLNDATYLNIHTTAFPGGEIRGELTPVAAPVPEPASFALLASGLLGVRLIQRRRVIGRS